MEGVALHCSNPLPTSYGVWGALTAAGFSTEPRPPKGFPLFSELRMASPDTIILLVVDHHAAIRGGGRPPLRTPLSLAAVINSRVFT